MSRVLVVKLGALGDILLAEGAFRDIRAHHPEAHISVLTRRGFVPLLSRCPWVDAVIADAHRPRWRVDAMWRLARTLRAGRFDLAYDLQNSDRSRFYLGRLWRGRWSGDVAGCALPHRHAAPKSLPVLERHAGQLADAGVPVRHTTGPAADWVCAPVDDLLAAHGLAGSRYVVLLPGSSARAAHKRWPHYAALADRLLAGGLVPVVVPGPEEGDRFDRLPGRCLREPSGAPLNLFRLAGVLRAATAVIGNDSGPTHLAASLGRPGIALFGGDEAAARRTCLGRGRMITLVAPRFSGLDANAVERALHLQLDAAVGDDAATFADRRTLAQAGPPCRGAQ